jgi:predicted transcriptional regulator YheO
MQAGATNINVQVAADPERLGSVTLHDALEGMMRAAERELGSESSEWNREDKQRVVRMLDERGAFLLRGAVDDIATAMGVSRITIYNYLNAINSGDGTS